MVKLKSAFFSTTVKLITYELQQHIIKLKLMLHKHLKSEKFINFIISFKHFPVSFIRMLKL